MCSSTFVPKLSLVCADDSLIPLHTPLAEVHHRLSIGPGVQDNIIGAKSKKECHQFDVRAGHLHRAFSVFLFDKQDRLLLQQRAACKVTFPDVWTNTCCSHQLHGHTPTETDDLDDVAHGRTPGAVAAAIRKLEHELGIPVSELEATPFTFLTRLLYCAEDTHATGEKPTGWGEHEMDYILFARADVTLNPNPDEIQDVRFVTATELKAMMHPDSGLRWSPWFRIIAQNFLHKWWDDLDGVLKKGKHADWRTIHKLDV
jgi:isopentenyl-diphosphate Delta-isomerase